MTEVIGVTGVEDPLDEAPWAMPLAFVNDKQSPASATAICEAAAMSVVALLADARATAPDGEWRASVERWTDGRIRKVVRRGKPALFQRATHLPGVTVEHRGATVRAFVPRSTVDLPVDLNRLQVSGSEPAERGTPSEGAFLTIAVNPAVASMMSVGKTAAQCGHAAQLAWMGMSGDTRKRWESASFSIRVVWPSEEEWDVLQSAKAVSVVDAGFTEIPPGSNTVIGLY